jgi:hypothetical protein
VITRSTAWSRHSKGPGSLGDVVDGMAVRILTRMSISATGYERAGSEIPTSLRSAWAEHGAHLT